MILSLFFIACTTPCEEPLPSESILHDVFMRLDKQQCLHTNDIHLMEDLLAAYHKQTTLHCDQVWRRTSIDGRLFDGPEQLVLTAASVADVFIERSGAHVLAYNDLRTSLLVETAIADPQKFWRMGLVGYGGLGLARDRMGGKPIERIETDLHLLHPQEVVDPDIGQTPDGRWRLVWFGVNPDQMNRGGIGPLNSSKPHYFYRAESDTLSDFGSPRVMVRSSEGMTGGADPTMATLPSGEEVLMVGPLDKTVMAWVSKNQKWKATAPPDFNTRAPLASPDLVTLPDGTYRLYGMENGNPSRILYYESKDGLKWRKGGLAYEDTTIFNASVDVDPVGTYWLYYNRTDAECLKKWGSKRVLPKDNLGTDILPPADKSGKQVPLLQPPSPSQAPPTGTDPQSNPLPP